MFLPSNTGRTSPIRIVVVPMFTPVSATLHIMCSSSEVLLECCSYATKLTQGHSV